MSLSSRGVVAKGRTDMPQKGVDIHKANNQAWSDLEGWLFEQIRPNQISADYKDTVALSAHLNNWDSHVSTEAHGKGALWAIAEK